MASDQFKYDRNSLDNLSQSVLDHEKAWNIALSNMIDSVNAFYCSTNISGNAGAALKNYVNDTYGTINTSLQTILYAHSGGWSQYLTELNAIDNSSKLKIHGQVLTDTSTDLDSELKTISGIDVEVGDIIKSVADIFTSPSRNVADVVNAQTALKTSVDTLKTDLQTLDSTHAAADFANSTEEISALKKYITTNDNTNRDSVSSYTTKSINNANAEKNLAKTNAKLTQQAVDNSDKWDAAKEKQLVHVEEVKADRQAKANKWKLIASVACIAASAALILVPGVGLGVAIAAGAAVGALNAVVNDAADEYAQHGDFNQLNVKKMAGDVVVEASIGATTAWVGGSGLEGVGKYAAKGGINLVKETYNSAKDYYKSHGNSFSGMNFGDCVVEGSIKAVASTAGDVVGDKAGEAFGKFTQNTKFSLGAQNKNVTRRVVSQITQSTAKSTAKGVTKRTTEAILDSTIKGEEKGFKDVINLKDSSKDIISGVWDGAVESASNEIAYKTGADQSINAVSAKNRGQSINVNSKDVAKAKIYIGSQTIGKTIGSVVEDIPDIISNDDTGKSKTDKLVDSIFKASQTSVNTAASKANELTKGKTQVAREVDLKKQTNSRHKTFYRNFNQVANKEETIKEKTTKVYEDSGHGSLIKPESGKAIYTNMKFTRQSGPATAN